MKAHCCSAKPKARPSYAQGTVRVSPSLRRVCFLIWKLSACYPVHALLLS